MESTKRCFRILAAASATVTTFIISYGFYVCSSHSSIGIALFPTSVKNIQVRSNGAQQQQWPPTHQKNKSLQKNVITHTEITKQRFNEIIRALEKRRDVLVSYCKERPSAEKAAHRQKAFYRWLFTNDDLNLIACVIPKVGSDYMKRLASPDHRFITSLEEDRPILSKYSREEKIKRVKSFFKVLFVRHPFHRLWSAYNSKLSLKIKGFLEVAQDIIRVTRDNLTNPDRICLPSVTFKEFISYIIEMHRQKRKLNNHWIRYHDTCFPCTMPYDFIGKMESFDEEVYVMIHKLGISKETHDNWTHINSSLEAKVNVGCRLTKMIKCHTKHDVVLVNFQNLAINGLVDPVEDKEALLSKIKYWMSTESNLQLLCIKEINRLLDRYPVEDRAQLVETRKAKVRNEAFSALPRDLLEKLELVYEPDFKGFGYNPAQI